MKLSIVCLHLLARIELPCVDIINDPVSPTDSGHTYLCLPCSARATQLTPKECACLCESHCDAMTITETLDARTNLCPKKARSPNL